MIPKNPRYENRRLLDLARDQPCANCGRQDGTTVAAHANWSLYGKGKSIKSHDPFHAWLCGPCHAWLDQGTGDDPTGTWPQHTKREMWERAYINTVLAQWRNGLIRVAQ